MYKQLGSISVVNMGVDSGTKSDKSSSTVKVAGGKPEFNCNNIKCKFVDLQWYRNICIYVNNKT